MKTIFVFVMTSFAVITPEAHALFGHVAAEKNRRQQAEQQLNISQQQLGEQLRIATDQQRMAEELQQTIVEQQRAANEQNMLTNKWRTMALVLGAFSIVTLIAGTAIGSRGRHHASRGE